MSLTIQRIADDPGLLLSKKDWTKKKKKTCEALLAFLTTHHQTLFSPAARLQTYVALARLRVKIAGAKPDFLSKTTLQATVSHLNKLVLSSHPLLALPNDIIKLILSKSLERLKDCRAVARTCHHWGHLVKATPELTIPLAERYLNNDSLLEFLNRFSTPISLTIHADSRLRANRQGRNKCADLYLSSLYLAPIQHLTIIGRSQQPTKLKECDLEKMTKLTSLTLDTICLTPLDIPVLQQMTFLSILTLSYCSSSQENNGITIPLERKYLEKINISNIITK